MIRFIIHFGYFPINKSYEMHYKEKKETGLHLTSTEARPQGIWPAVESREVAIAEANANGDE